MCWYKVKTGREGGKGTRKGCRVNEWAETWSLCLQTMAALVLSIGSAYCVRCGGCVCVGAEQEGREKFGTVEVKCGRPVVGGVGRSLTLMATATGVVHAHRRAKGDGSVTSSKAWGDRQRHPDLGRLHCACQPLCREGWPTRRGGPQAGGRVHVSLRHRPPWPWYPASR